MTPIDVIRAVARDYGVSPADVLGSRRTARLVEPRHLAIWLARDLLDMSFPALARAFRRDSSTVQHAVRRAEQLLACPVVRHRMDRVRCSVIGCAGHLEERIRRLEEVARRAGAKAQALRAVVARIREES